MAVQKFVTNCSARYVKGVIEMVVQHIFSTSAFQYELNSLAYINKMGKAWMEHAGTTETLGPHFLKGKS